MKIRHIKLIITSFEFDFSKRKDNKILTIVRGIADVWRYPDVNLVLWIDMDILSKPSVKTIEQIVNEFFTQRINSDRNFYNTFKHLF